MIDAGLADESTAFMLVNLREPDKRVVLSGEPEPRLVESTLLDCESGEVTQVLVGSGTSSIALTSFRLPAQPRSPS